MRIRIVNFDDYYDNEKVVKNHKPVISGQFTEDGIFSEKIFGSLEEDVVFSCKCGESKGNFLEGVICDHCHTEVKKSIIPFNRIGWLDFDKYYFIHPLFYSFIEKIIPDLPHIINYQLNINKEGEEVGRVPDEDEADNNIKNKLYNLGLRNFKHNFSKILTYCYKNNKRREALTPHYEFLLDNIDNIFINKFPIYGINLRPAILKGNNLIFDRINDYYNKIVYNINLIKQNNVLDIKYSLPLLYVIQISLNKIFNYVLNNIKGKGGILRNNLLGCRVNFSMRAVIIPADSSKDIDEIEIPYVGFMELYKFQIIRALVIRNSIDYNTANKIWLQSVASFNKELYDTIITPMLETGNLQVLLNRNPTISFGSILLLRLTGVKRDIEDYTMSISNNILQILAGDYDGDCLNLIAVMDEKYKAKFAPLNPKEMLLSINDGKFNSQFSLDNDQILGIKSFLEF